MGEADRCRSDVLVSGLYAEYGRSVLMFVTRLTGDRTGAEDIVQETLVRAWKHADDLVEDKGSVLGWLLTVARNLVADRARARALRPVELGAIAEHSRVHGDHSESVVNTMMLGDALRQVSAEHRDVVVELYYRGRSVTEAARELGVPPGTVKSRSYYALRALRTLISASGP
ncbi:sigma-70 family RNA polymerase sigma factor [Kribbella sp. NPDC049227]|uniref:sigma-70 family RNA polymerase sigma factor n=1 Tax=Kribbella sp. NPDC049227 TaxID=3364113 RepID=UPI003711E100